VGLRGRRCWEAGIDYNEEIHNLYNSTIIILVIKLRMMDRAFSTRG